jgi:isopentenyl-diphosphate delta-isomerase
MLFVPFTAAILGWFMHAGDLPLAAVSNLPRAGASAARFKSPFGGIKFCNAEEYSSAQVREGRMTVVTHEERVVLLDDAGNSVGSAAKATIHHQQTPLHLGFSCYLFDESGRVLLTRRALGKQTWPGVWTNSFCGHPAPGESTVDAVRRRGHDELGADLADVVCVLPDFRYRAQAADGTWENEICPVFCALIGSTVAAAPEEVMELVWISWDELQSAAQFAWAISPWARSQVPQLESAELPAWARPRD